MFLVLCGLVGGPGLVSGGNFNNELAVFEQATRNSGRKIAGRNLANPTAYMTATSKVFTKGVLFIIERMGNLCGG